MMHKNSNLEAAWFVVRVPEPGRIKFLAGFDDRGDADAAAAEWSMPDRDGKTDSPGAAVVPAEHFFARRPDMVPEAPTPPADTNDTKALRQYLDRWSHWNAVFGGLK